MSGSRTNTTTTTANSAPWAPAQPYLKNALSEAGGLFNAGVGFNPNTTSMVTPFSKQTQRGMNGIETAAQRYIGSNAHLAPQRHAMDVIYGGGMNAQMKAAAKNATSRMNGDGFNDYSRNAMENWQATANGGDMEGNPYFEDVLQQSIDDARNAVNMGAMGNGRYGSSPHSGVMTQEIGDLSSRARYQNFMDQQARMDAANANLMQGGQIGYGNRAGAAGELAGYGQQAMANKTAAAASLPGIYQARMQPYRDMMGVGAMNEDLYTRQLNDQARVFDETQARPWERLAAANAVFSGTGAMGGTTTQAASTPRPSPFASALGGAVKGFGATQNPLGALAGGTLGLFS